MYKRQIIPDPETVTDWDNERTFRVTSYNGDAREYTYKAVSYTHLDESASAKAVDWFVLMFMLRGIPFVDLAHLRRSNLDTVSYTHLDVYKRQLHVGARTGIYLIEKPGHISRTPLHPPVVALSLIHI